MKSLFTQIVIASLLFLSTQLYSQQSGTGFYVIIEEKVGCANLVPALIEIEMYCLPADAVITDAEFEQVSDVKYDKAKQSKFVELKLSQAGSKTLKTLAGKLPNSRFALVVDGKVVGVFENTGAVSHRIVPIRGESATVEWIHNKIKTTKP